jgi:uncharacterized protein YukE
MNLLKIHQRYTECWPGYIDGAQAISDIMFLLSELDGCEKKVKDAEARVEREHGWATVWADTAEEYKNIADKLKHQLEKAEKRVKELERDKS